MRKCASCKYITFNVVSGDRCMLTGRHADNGKYCKSYEMVCGTKDKSIEANNARMLSVIENAKRR